MFMKRLFYSCEFLFECFLWFFSHFAGGVRCLSILNIVFAITFGLLALFLGSTLLTLGSSCALPLFWCYEIASWGLVTLYGGTAFFLRRKAATILDESNFAGRNHGLEMLEANPLEVTPDMERRVNEGFKTWVGTSYLSSDEEDNPDDYLEAPQVSRTNSSRQRGWLFDFCVKCSKLSFHFFNLTKCCSSELCDYLTDTCNDILTMMKPSVCYWWRIKCWVSSGGEADISS